MNARIFSAFLALATLVGCVARDHDHSPPPSVAPGDVTLSWSFAGLGCAQVPEIRGVRVSIPGEVLQNDGFYPCQVEGYPGITLFDFAPGSYDFTLEAYGWNDAVLYGARGRFEVNGSVRVSMDLTPHGRPSSYAYVTWRFPANELSPSPNCAQARVRWIDLRIDDGAWERFDCALGLEQPGIQTGYLEPGSHTIELVALDATYGYPTHSFIGALTTSAHAPVASDYQLQWEVGGAALGWRLKDGAMWKSCAQANVTEVVLHFVDEYGQYVYGAAGDAHACQSAPIVYRYLAPGTYKVYIAGYGPNGVTYLSDEQSPPTVVVQAGVFPDASGPLELTLFRASN